MDDQNDYVSINSNCIHPPGQPLGNFLTLRIPATRANFCLIPLPRAKNDGKTPRGTCPKNLPGGWDLTFEFCPGAGNSTRAGTLCKRDLKLKKIAFIKFLQVKTKKTSRIFDLFEVYTICVFQWDFSWSMGQFFGSAVTHTLQKI